MRFRHTERLYMDRTTYDERKNHVSTARIIISKKKCILCVGKIPLVNAQYWHMV